MRLDESCHRSIRAHEEPSQSRQLLLCYRTLTPHLLLSRDTKQIYPKSHRCHAKEVKYRLFPCHPKVYLAF